MAYPRKTPPAPLDLAKKSPKSTRKRLCEPTPRTPISLKNFLGRSEGVSAPLFVSGGPGDHFFGLYRAQILIFHPFSATTRSGMPKIGGILWAPQRVSKAQRAKFGQKSKVTQNHPKFVPGNFGCPKRVKNRTFLQF